VRDQVKLNRGFHTYISQVGERLYLQFDLDLSRNSTRGTRKSSDNVASYRIEIDLYAIMVLAWFKMLKNVFESNEQQIALSKHFKAVLLTPSVASNKFSNLATLALDKFVEYVRSTASASSATAERFYHTEVMEEIAATQLSDHYAHIVGQALSKAYKNGKQVFTVFTFEGGSATQAGYAQNFSFREDPHSFIMPLEDMSPLGIASEPNVVATLNTIASYALAYGGVRVSQQLAEKILFPAALSALRKAINQQQRLHTDFVNYVEQQKSHFVYSAMDLLSFDRIKTDAIEKIQVQESKTSSGEASELLDVDDYVNSTQKGSSLFFDVSSCRAIRDLIYDFSEADERSELRQWLGRVGQVKLSCKNIVKAVLEAFI
jgi:hypothetical protein